MVVFENIIDKVASLIANLDVSMGYILLVNVVDSRRQLKDYEFAQLFVHRLFFIQNLIQVSIWEVLHDDVSIFAGFVPTIQLNYAWLQ